MGTTRQTYALTVVVFERKWLFQRLENAELLVDTLFRYRDQSRFLLHGFVVMPDHGHILLSPDGSIEKATQMIKGGFSFAVRKQFHGQVWQGGYHAHRVLDECDYWNQLGYIAQNPVKRGFGDYPFVHTQFSERLDPAPSEWRR